MNLQLHAQVTAILHVAKYGSYVHSLYSYTEVKALLLCKHCCIAICALHLGHYMCMQHATGYICMTDL